jgi:hypothetical protein
MKKREMKGGTSRVGEGTKSTNKPCRFVGLMESFEVEKRGR